MTSTELDEWLATPLDVRKARENNTLVSWPHPTKPTIIVTRRADGRLFGDGTICYFKEVS